MFPIFFGIRNLIVLYNKQNAFQNSQGSSVSCHCQNAYHRIYTFYLNIPSVLKYWKASFGEFMIFSFYSQKNCSHIHMFV